MPRYFFDISVSGQIACRDHRGLELPDLDIAQIEAVEIWNLFEAEQDRAVAHVVEISDDRGVTLAVANEGLQALLNIPASVREHFHRVLSATRAAYPGPCR